MKLEQNQELTLFQALKMYLVIGCFTIILLALSVGVIYTPIRNFIRNYKPTPTSQLHHT